MDKYHNLYLSLSTCRAVTAVAPLRDLLANNKGSVILFLSVQVKIKSSTVLPAKSDSDYMFCLQSYQGLRIDRSLVY